MTDSALSRDGVVDRAVAIADAEGLDAVTVRRIAQEFGVTPMALYWHVQNKDGLLAAMGDRLYAGIDLTDDPTAPWSERLRALMESLVAAMRRHPALLPFAYERIMQNEDGRRATEYALALLREGGFTVRDSANIAVQALRTAVGLVQDEPGTARGVPDPDRDEHLRVKRAALSLLPPAEFPNVLEAADDLLACADQAEYDDFGVELFVAGVLALSHRATAGV